MAACLALCGTARAADLGEAGGFAVQWDSTVRSTLGLRTEDADAALLANINGDDGDRSFRPGVTSTRLDLFSEVTGSKGDLGFDLSAQGWYDPVYFQHTADRSAATFNADSVKVGSLPADVRRLMGGDAELLNAFVKDGFSVEGLPVSLRVGRQTLLWGESLFFAQNGIAAGQAPVDQIKALGAPLAQARELYLPVAQAVLRVQLRPGLALEAYDQFEWRRDRLPGVGSYFSTTDILDAGGQTVLRPGQIPLYRVADATPHGLGQFGVALRQQGDTVDLGLYALRYDAKAPVPVYESAAYTYRLVFPRGIDMLGASASTYVGDSTLAGEISWRHDMPLIGSGAAVAGAAGGLGGGGIGYAAYLPPGYRPPPLPFVASATPVGPVAVGDTWQAQISTVSQLPPGRWWQGASLQAEAAANDLIAVTGGGGAVQPGRTHFAAGARAVFTAQYFQVLPGLDLGVPLGVGYTPVGRSSLNGSQNAGSGDVTVGVSGTFRAVWQGALAFTHFVGGAGRQFLADRDFVSISVARSF